MAQERSSDTVTLIEAIEHDLAAMERPPHGRAMPGTCLGFPQCLQSNGCVPAASELASPGTGLQRERIGCFCAALPSLSFLCHCIAAWPIAACLREVAGNFKAHYLVHTGLIEP